MCSHRSSDCGERPLGFTVRSRMKRLPSCLLLTLCVIVTCACTKAVPPIARGLAIPFGPTPEFGSRLQSRFPVGSSVGTLLAELRAEGFSIHIDPLVSTATYEVVEFPCRDVWKVEWEAAAQKITSITGDARAICL